MAVEMPPITEVKMTPGELGPRLRDLAQANSSYFVEQRFLPSVVSRWASLNDHEASERVAHIQKAHAKGDGEFRAFIAIDSDDFVQGMGTMQRSPNPMLRRLHVPLPRGLLTRIGNHLGGVGISECPDAAVNLSAWVDETREFDLLKGAYASLLSHHKREYPKSEEGDPVAWTIEPARSRQFIHATIRASGLVEVDTARYDDQEASRWQVPPRAVLYTQHASTLDI